MTTESAARAVARAPWFRAAAFAVCVAAALAAHRPTIYGLVALSTTDDAASHLLLVPLITAALIWHRRLLAGVPLGWDWRAGIVVAAAAALCSAAAGTVTDAGNANVALSVSVAAIVLFVLAAFLVAFGRAAFRAACFPLCFLLFTIPLPPALLDGTTEFLKVWSTELTDVLFDVTRIPHHRDLFVFTLPTVVIEVADQCSGIRSSIALVLTTMLAGYSMLDNAWKRMVLMAMVVPVAVLKNAIRIVSLSWLATNVNPEFLSGRLHRDGGVVFFLLALAILYPIALMLQRIGRSPTRVEPRPVAAT